MDDTSWNLDALVEAHAAADRSPRARVRRLAAWILEDPARPYRLDGLADRAALSPRSLTRLFRSETGTTPARFVEQARVRLARLLLERTGLAIGAIASRCGFGSDERMRRAFHRRLGSCPRRYASTGSGTMRR